MREKFDQLMAEMPASWRYNWCTSSFCSCMGAANCSGGLVKAGFTKKHWDYWVSQNPEPELGQPIKSISFNPPEAKAPAAAISSADDFFAWQDSLSRAELEAYEEGRLAVGTRFTQNAGFTLEDPVEITVTPAPAPATPTVKAETIDECMAAMPEAWRNRWCGGGICACMGAANCSGRLAAKGFTQEDWIDWKRRNGISEPPRSSNVVRLVPKALSLTIANIVDGNKA